MLATTASSTLLGVEGRPVTVEVHVGCGLPGFTIVGQPDGACREARDRVRAAMLEAKLEWPNQKITVNLAPSGVRKVGGGLDLAIAMATAAASEQIPASCLAGVGFLAELGLDGSLRSVQGTLPLVDAIDADTVVVAPAAGAAAAYVAGRRVRTVPRLRDLVDSVTGATPWPDLPPAPQPSPPRDAPDLGEVRGQPMARRALEVAAAGGHHVLLIGPPGAGKTMLASRLPGLLPPLEPAQALEVARIHSAGGVDVDLHGPPRPPYRSPHHGASPAALVGGGSHWLRPGEASLAHGGVLFLDELGEFAPSVLDALRQPLESGRLTISRARQTVELPARFLLVAAMNPCPCGFATVGTCRCGPGSLARYRRRLSGPLLDRFDLRIVVGRPDPDALFGECVEESTSDVAARVAAARTTARERQARLNIELSGAELDRHARLDRTASALLEHEVRSGRLSARGMHRVRAVARTIIDLAGVSDGPVGPEAIRAALGLRGTDDVLAGV